MPIDTGMVIAHNREAIREVCHFTGLSREDGRCQANHGKRDLCANLHVRYAGTKLLERQLSSQVLQKDAAAGAAPA